jgi:hypothetical protein
LTIDTSALTAEPSRPQSKGLSWPLIVVWTLYLVLAGRLLWIVYRYAVNIFFADAWACEYLVAAGHHSIWSMFRMPFGPHRQGLGALFSYVIGSCTHWNSRTETFAVGAVIVCAAGCALLLKKRLYGNLTYTDVAVPLLLLNPSQFEMLASYANPSHGPLPLLLVVLYGLAWTVEPAPLRYGLLLVVNFLLTYTGFGLFMGVLTPWLLALEFYNRRQQPGSSSRRPLVFAILLSVLSLFSFFVGYNYTAATVCYGSGTNATVTFSGRSSLGYLWFMSLMFANFAGRKGFGPLTIAIGALLLAAASVALAWCVKELLFARTQASSGANPVRKLVPAALLAYGIVFAVSTAVGRLCVDDPAAAQKGRYMPYLALAFLGVYFSLVSARRSDVKNVSLAALLAMAVLSSISIHSVDRGRMAWIAAGKEKWKNCYLVQHDISRCDAQSDFRLDPNVGGDLQGKLAFLQQNRLNLFAPR